MRLLRSLSLLAFLPLFAGAVEPPAAARDPKSICHVLRTAAGEKEACRTDDFSWLRQREAVEGLRSFGGRKQPWRQSIPEYIAAEMAYTDAAWAPLQSLTDQLTAEMKERLPEKENSVAVLRGGWEYYSVTPPGKTYLTYRRRNPSTQVDQVLLDLNEVAAALGKPVNGTEPILSPDGRYVAYGLDLTQSWSYGLYVKNLESGAVETIRRGNANLGPDMMPVWNQASTQLYYLLHNDANRPFDLRRHNVSPVATPEGAETGLADEQVYQENDDTLFLFLQASRDGRYAIAFSKGHDRSESRVISLGAPDSKPQLIAPKAPGHIYSVDHAGGRFFIRTNLGAPNFKLVTAPDDDATRWTDLGAYQPETSLESVVLFRDRVVTLERRHSFPQIHVRDFRNKRDYLLKTRSRVNLLELVDNVDFEATQVRYRYETYIDPQEIRELDFDSGKDRLLVRTRIGGGYQPGLYEQKRIFARARDGKPVPITLVYRKGVRLRAGNPLYVQSYGNYGTAWPSAYWGAFDLSRPSILDRGVVWAWIHTRGSSDLGFAAYQDGKLQRKMNTFHDFIDGLQSLYRMGVSQPERTVVQSWSAGGLLVGYLVNKFPGIAKAFIANVPFVDLINTLIDRTIPLTSQEWLEWGNPHVPAEYGKLLEYSPYDNVPRDGPKKRYPNLFVTTHLNDYSVYYWEPLKWVARMRANSDSQGQILLRVWPDGGHVDFAGQDAVRALRRPATNYTFVLSQLGINP
jgi:oligopeptidase B